METNVIMAYAELAAVMAKIDTTAPDPGNLRSGWRTDQLLRDLELVTIQRDDPRAYIEITRQALQQIKIREMPEVAALFFLAILNGERRLPVNEEQEVRLLEMIHKLNRVIERLPEGTRKLRCQSLLFYNTGVFSGAYGQFGEAARFQEQAAEHAFKIGDEPGAAVCLFLEVVYSIKQELCLGVPGKAEELLPELEKRFSFLAEKTSGSAMEVTWGQGNGPWHMLEILILLNRLSHPMWNTLVGTSLAAALKLGQAFEPAARLIRAVDLYVNENDRAEQALVDIAEGGDADEMKAVALLVLARIALKSRQKDLARDLVGSMPAQGAQHVRAIAVRLFV